MARPAAAKALADRREQARRRARLIRLLLARVDGILAGLILVHERTLRRRNGLLDRKLGRDLFDTRRVARGRGRIQAP